MPGHLIFIWGQMRGCLEGHSLFLMQLPEHSCGPGTEPGTGNQPFFSGAGWAGRWQDRGLGTFT